MKVEEINQLDMTLEQISLTNKIDEILKGAERNMSVGILLTCLFTKLLEDDQSDPYYNGEIEQTYERDLLVINNRLFLIWDLLVSHRTALIKEINEKYVIRDKMH
jgi:hypothetical protein